MIKKNYGLIALILTALIWGIGFIAVDLALDRGYQVGEIIAYRGLIGGILLIPFLFKKKALNLKMIIFSILAGLSVFFGYVFQTLGQQLAGVTSSAFYTSLYVVITPILAFLITKNKLSNQNIISIILALIGVFFMSFLAKPEGASFGLGELYLIICALLFAIQLIIISLFLKDADPMASTSIMNLTIGIGGLFYMLFTKTSFTKINSSFIWIIYIGLFATMLASLLIFMARNNVKASKTSIILSLETPFAYLFSLAIGLENFNIFSLFGVIIILVSINIVNFEFINLKKYKYLFLDLDNTILNFDKSEKKCFKQALAFFNIKYRKDLYLDYQKENHALWLQYEKEEILKNDIFDNRLVNVFKKYHIEADPKAVSYKYLEFLSQSAYFMPLAKSSIKYLAKHYELYLISNGQKDVQYGRLNKANINQYFKKIYLSDEIGYQKPKTEFFEYIFNDLKIYKKDVIVIGDSITSDILGANNYGLDALYVNRKESTEICKYNADYLWQIR